MCGFTGFWQFNKQTFNKPYDKIALEMAARISYRGPDDEGAWVDQDAGLALGHRRLSILDLSSAGHQPMQSRSQRFIIAYNGEVYNAPDIRSELEEIGISFRSHSDTEVMLEAMEQWGVHKAVQKFIGMFAFALWDKKEKSLYLVRDRLGIKPLYWGRHQGVLFFGSQLRSFQAHPLWSPTINRQALVSYFRFNYVPTPLTIYEDFNKLPPGTILKVDSQGQTEEQVYWNFKTLAEDNSHHRRSFSDRDTIDQLEVLLKDAVNKRLLSDVPLGAFLSGGVDSSTVVALMQHQSAKPVKTFSIGFHEDAYNEAHHAKEVAKHLKTDHHELYLASGEAQDIIPNLCDWYDEPFADSSQIPTYLVSRMTREHVTVALSGDGGDELFAGYSRYFLGQSLWKKISRVPLPMKNLVAAALRTVSPAAWDQIDCLIPSRIRPQHVGDKVYKLANVFQTSGLPQFYKSLVSQWETPIDLVSGENEVDLWTEHNLYPSSTLTWTEQMQFLDTLTYLPDDILTKVDRASMAVSLEARVPLLDHRVVEFAWSMPESQKIRLGQGKWALRQILYRYVPKEMIERPKMGFGVPIGVWMRGAMREWAETLLSECALKNNGLNPGPIRQRWEEHLSGRRNWEYSLWSVLMYQSWIMSYKNL